MQRLVRQEFDRIMAAGDVEPNEAAQQALRAAAERAQGPPPPSGR
jgi:hypothetical protein